MANDRIKIYKPWGLAHASLVCRLLVPALLLSLLLLSLRPAAPAQAVGATPQDYRARFSS